MKIIRINHELKKENKELEEKNKNLKLEKQYLKNENNGLYKENNELIVENDEITKEYKKIAEFCISQNKEIEDLISKNNNLKYLLEDGKKEIKLIKLKNQNLKEELKKDKSNWIIEADSGWRINQITEEREEYKIPYDFNIEMVRDLKFSKEGKFRKFKYYDKSMPGERFGSWRFFEIPISLYNKLCNNESDENYLDLRKEQNNNIKNILDLKKFLEKKGLKLNGIYSENTYKFIFENIRKSFTTKEFIKDCHFRNRESARQYLQKLIEFEIIRRFGKGDYKVII